MEDEFLLVEGKGALAVSESLRSWVLATLPEAIAFATSLLRDRNAAEDIVHDCYCRLLQKASVYDLPRDGMKIMLRSITNACIDRKGRERVLLSLDAIREAENSAGNHWVDHRAEQPLQRAMARELEQAMEEGLDRLPMAQRAALHMKSTGHSLQDIADTLGISVGNAGILVHRARQAMSQYLAPYLEEKSP
jgi:RNA polymerase sigma-70 factor (ECF subfamily)